MLFDPLLILALRLGWSLIDGIRTFAPHLHSAWPTALPKIEEETHACIVELQTRYVGPPNDPPWEDGMGEGA